MSVRYTLTPQMIEYDRVGQVWLPYVMYFHTPNYSSSVINTDSRGFRIAYKESRRISNFEDIGQLPLNLCIGGSLVFGVGATNDSTTIPSILPLTPIQTPVLLWHLDISLVHWKV